MKKIQYLALTLVMGGFLAFSGPAFGQYDNIGDLQMVDSQGDGNHPKLQMLPPDGRVTVRGVVLNATEELNTNPFMYYFYVQDETGGLQVFAARFYRGGDPFPQHYIDNAPQAGDEVEVTGMIGFFGGKTNINERHNSHPDFNFHITILNTGNPMPEPIPIPSVAACTFFDQTRATGGEYYQGRWCKIEGLYRVSGTWEAGKRIVVTDGTGELTVHLSAAGDFSDNLWPREPFSLTGIFNQEDLEAPFTNNYEIWVKSMADVEPWQPSSAENWTEYR